MDEFLVNFYANLAADAILAPIIAIIIYYLVTKPGEKKKDAESFKRALVLLQTEIDINMERAQKYVQALNSPIDDINSLSPMRYTRGAWNALKESGFLPKLNNPELVHHLLRMNETALVANKNLRKLQLAYLEKTKRKKPLLAAVAKKESTQLLSLYSQVASSLDQMNLPSFEVEYIDEDEIPEEEELEE